MFSEPNIPIYFVMEFVEGNTLEQLVANKSKLDLDQSIGVVFDLCKSLRVVVKQQITHRDIKPDNLMIRALNPPDVVMLDFGVAYNPANEPGVTTTNETFGSSFLSLPEHRGLHENKRDSRSDLTSVCAILFYCLTGKSPRDLRDSSGKPPHVVHDAILKTTVGDSTRFAFLKFFFDRGLSYEISERFQSLDDLEKHLKNVVSPASKPSEDIATVAARHSKRLRRLDTVTRFQDYRKRLEPVRIGLVNSVNGIQRSGLGDFFVTFNGATFPNPAMRLTEIYSYPTELHVQGHQLYHQITYSIREEGNDCVVYRNIVSRNPRPGISEDVVVFEGDVEVHRYVAEGEPSVELLVEDLRATIARCMEKLVEQITQPKR